MARKSAWVSTAIAAKSLGISVKTLLRLKKAKKVTPGVHFRCISSPDAVRHSYRWHLKKMESLMTKWSSQ
jgi:hypothetical protein